MMSTSVRSNSLATNLVADLSAGLVVFLVALPLCLGVALASNGPLFSGIVAGVVGGLVVGVLSKSQTSVSGPAAGLTAVVAAQISALGSFQAFLLAVVVAGVLQIGLGLIRAGSIADFVPTSVIKGLLAAIGLILILKQFPHLLGHLAVVSAPVADQPPSHENIFVSLGRTLLHLNIHRGACLIGFVSVGVLLVWDKVQWLKHSLVPGPLVAVSWGVAANFGLERLGNEWRIPTSLAVQVPVAESLQGFLGFLQFPDFSAWLNPAIYSSAVTIALVASLETLLNLEAVDKIDPQKRVSPPNRELIAQGVGNMISGFIGGLPLTSVIVRSSVNINAGGKTKLSAIFHGCLLLLCVALLPTLLNRIPLSCLAAVLIMTGFKLASPKLFRQQWKAGLDQFLPLLITVVAILLTDLLIGILIGLGFSILFILRSNLRSPMSRTIEKHLGGDVLHIELANQVGFLNRVALWKALEEVPSGGHVLLDARRADYIDADVLAVIREYEEEVAPVHGVAVSLIGFKPHYDQIEDRVQYVDLATRELRERLTPEQVLQILREGNERFRTGHPLTRDLARLREETATARYPLAVVLSGSSARTPLELVFDAGLGELFCTRTIGNMAGPTTLGSLEYACAIAGAKLLVVLGHTDNKAVRLAIEELARGGPSSIVQSCPNLASVFDEFRQAVDSAVLREWNAANAERQRQSVDQVSQTLVQRTLQRILERSDVLRERARAEQLKLVGAMYDVSSGAVAFLHD